MFRKSLSSFLLLALLGGAGHFAWKNHTTARPGAAEPALHPQQTSPAALPPSTRLDFLTDIALPYQVRITQLRNTLATECSEPEIRFLYRLLEQGPAKGEIPEHWYVIANDLMIRILADETDPQRFATRFTALLKDPQQPEVIRDYAVQYLAAWLNPRSAQATASSLATPPPEIAAQVLLSLAAATTDPALEQSSIPGTTLMMLVDLTRSGSGVDCTQAIATLKPWLARALQDGSTLSNPIRVSAVGAAGILAPAEFRPLIRKIAYQDNGASSLRLPAVAALGQAGEAEDLAKLRAIAATSPELSYAAHDAVVTLEAGVSNR